MEESNEALRVVPELYFLIAKFLSSGPLKETAKTLLKELESVNVLPWRLDWEGNEHAQSYDEINSQHQDVPWDRLASVCDRAVHLARLAVAMPQALAAAAGAPPTASTSAPAVTTSQAEMGNKLETRLSLLSESLVRPKPKYASFKQDHSIVRRVLYREMGTGASAQAGGRGGKALFPPRLLCGLNLQRRTLGHLSAVYCLVFDCTGRYVVTGADDLLVKVWNASDGRLLATLRGAGAEITDVCASHDGALLAAGSVERLVRVWCLVTGAPKAVLHAHAGTITAVHWAPPAHDVRWLASTSTDGSVAFWTCADGQFLSQPVQYVERLRPGACHMICAAWSAGGAFLAAGSADHHVRLYAVHREPGGPRRVLETAVHGDAVDSIAWAHRGLRFVSGSKDGSAALWALHATQWRHSLLQAHAHAADAKRLKVTMVCWDCSDAYVVTAVSDNTIRVWCSRTCTQVNVLHGHRDEAYVLEAHPFLPSVLLSAGHDGQLFVWDVHHGEVLSHFHNNIPGQGDGAIFDAKWGGGATVAASDSHGHLLLLGLGRGHRLLGTLPTELFFHTDYRPLVRDALGGALDEQTELPPHLMPPPFLVDVEGGPHPPALQRLVPGRELLTLSQLIPAATAPSAIDQMIQALAAERDEVALAAPTGGVWRGEGVRHTAGSWQRGDPLLVPHSTRPIVRPLSQAQRRHRDSACREMNALELAWYRREMRRRPLMISTASAHSPAKGPRRRGGRPRAPQARPQPRLQEEPPEPESVSGSETSDSSVRLSGSARGSVSSRDSRSNPSSDSSSSSSSQYSDWEAGAALAPPARARRRPLPANRYSPSVSTPPKRPDPASPVPLSPPRPGPAAAWAPGPPGEAYRVGEWLTAVSPRKAPYHPQMGDECLYFRLGHQRYFEAVAEKDLYKINPRDKPWERTHVYECESVKLIGIKYMIKPPRVVSLRLAATLGGPRTFTVRYHDMPDVIDFLVLRQQYEQATQRHWGQGDRFRCMIDDSWWTGVVLERAGPGPGGGGPSSGDPGAPADGDPAAAFSASAAPHFLSLKVRWDNGEVERLSPWDLEPIDIERLPSEPGGSVPVLPHELEAALYRAEPHEWPPRGDRPAAARAIAQHVGQVMTLSVAEPFVAPVDLQQYPAYARVVPYPIDLATIRARFDNLFYRRAAAAQFDVRYLASNAEQFNEPHSPIVRQARLVTDLLLYSISHWREVDVMTKYRELAASYHSSDDEPLAATANKGRAAGAAGAAGAGGAAGAAGAGARAAGWAQFCRAVLRELMRSPDSEPFKQPVSPDAAPDYSLVVSQPMDLGTVSERLSAGRYARKEAFAADVRQVFANSRTYNTNKRSRIYSMTVRLSALFASLWSRAPADPVARTRHQGPSRPRRTETMNGTYSPEPSQSYPTPHSDSSSSSSETLAATSRRVHAHPPRDARSARAPRPRRHAPPARLKDPRDHDSWDSDTPLQTHRKGKGVGKKSKSSSNSAEPVPSTSAAYYVPYTETNGHGSVSSLSASAAPASATEDSSQSEYTNVEVLEEELAEDEAEVTYEEPRTDPESIRSSRRAHKRALVSSDLSAHDAQSDAHSDVSGSSIGRGWRARSRTRKHKHKKHKHQPKRTRERFTSGSSVSSNSSASSSSPAPAPDARHYESDHSYRPRYSTDDDAPLLMYRQRQEGPSEAQAQAGPSRGRAANGHSKKGRGVSLRARRSPRRYNEDSEEDSVAAISKRSQHHLHQQRRRQQQLRHRQHHAQRIVLGAHSDHDYFNGHASLAPPAPLASRSPPPLAPLTPNTPVTPHSDQNGASGPVSISSRGRVRKLTAKARGLLHD